jgi:hypothetical protein
MNLTTFTSRAAAALVAAVAGIISYQHIVAVALGAGEGRSAAVLVPLAIDGLIVVGTMAMIEDKRRGRVPRLSARFALGFGILATVCANVASAEPTWTARAVAVVPALSFLISVEVLARTGRQPAAPDPPTSGNPLSATESAQAGQVGTGSRTRSRTGRGDAARRVERARSRHPAASQAEVARRAKLSVRTVARYWAGTAPEPVAEPSPNSREHSGAPVTADA